MGGTAVGFQPRVSHTESGEKSDADISLVVTGRERRGERKSSYFASVKPFECQ